MNDAAVRDIARRAGVSVQWTDYANKRHRVPLDAVRRILAALALPCDSAQDIAHSRHVLEEPGLPRLLTAVAGQPIDLPLPEGGGLPHRARLLAEDGAAEDLPLSRRGTKQLRLPAIATAGYHTLEIGTARIALAVAPARCVTVADLAPGERVWGLAAQIYGLRSPGDCGIGDMAGAAALAKASARRGADALALSPTHALFAADPGHFSPYSPSSRLFYNPLLADPAALFGETRVARARTAAGIGLQAREREAAGLIDWLASARAKLAVLRCLFEDFWTTDAAAGSELAAEFVKFRAVRGAPLEQHALFETLHAARLQADAAWDWRTWPAPLRDPASPAVREFAQKNGQEVAFHCFLQWVADRSLSAAQQQARQSGMRIGLVADLAVGMNGGGSHAWTNQDDILGGLQVGAPPDLFNPGGQSWGLTTFSPRALRRNGFAAFLATIRACMRHAGGVRIDHAMGLMRLWVTPDGAKPAEGAYLSYPLEDLLRLTALESHRHRAIVIGEDLGTVPAGFRDRLAATGIYGMRVLWFERDERDETVFAPPRAWPPDTVAMTSTHDLPTVAGWWRGRDIETRAGLGLLGNAAREQASRRQDRAALWNAFQSAGVAGGAPPAPEQGARVADAAMKFIAATPPRLRLLPLEDALALEEQPNLPGTVDEHPNWRRRYDGDAAALLDAPEVDARLKPLAKRMPS